MIQYRSDREYNALLYIHISPKLGYVPGQKELSHMVYMIPLWSGIESTLCIHIGVQNGFVFRDRVVASLGVCGGLWVAFVVTVLLRRWEWGATAFRSLAIGNA